MSGGDVSSDLPATGSFQGPRAVYVCPQYDRIEANTLLGFMKLLNGKGAHNWHVEGKIYMDRHWWTEEPVRYWCFLKKMEKVL